MELVTNKAVVALHMVELDHADEKVGEQVGLKFGRDPTLLREVLQVHDVGARGRKGEHPLQEGAFHQDALVARMRLDVPINNVIYQERVSERGIK